MENLPNKSSSALKDIFWYFDLPIHSVNDINKVFFTHPCPFFTNVSKYYPKEGNEFVKIFPYLRNLVHNIDTLFPNKGIETLKTKENKSIKLTRKHIALVFLLSFFDLIKVNNSNKKNYFNVSNILFNNYGSAFNFGLCFLNYLIVIGKWLSQNNPILDEEIIFMRKNINNINYLEQKKEVKLCDLIYHNKGSLFEGEASYCVDFANKYIGGGVLNGGCVQEEILFAVEPEAIVSLFFMEVMDSCDAIGIFNTIQYSKYKGYGYNFTYDGCLIDGITPIKRHRIIAIDAISRSSYNFFSFRNDKEMKNSIIRDIHKAYVGFSLSDSLQNIPKTIATGNWGCGAFNGNHELKFIQQWIAASFAGIERLYYYSFGDEKMQKVEKCYTIIKEKFKNAKNLYDALLMISNLNENYIDNLLNLNINY